MYLEFISLFLVFHVFCCLAGCLKCMAMTCITCCDVCRLESLDVSIEHELFVDGGVVSAAFSTELDLVSTPVWNSA